MNEQELVKVNNEWALGDLIAIEKHCIEQGSNGVPHKHCINKHRLHLIHHSLGEAQEHSFSFDEELSKKYGEFKNKANEILLSPDVNVSDVRDLRNEFREIIQDPTLSSCNGVCSLDKLNSSNVGKSEVQESNNSTIYLVLLGLGVIIGGYALFKLTQNQNI